MIFVPEIEPLTPAKVKLVIDASDDKTGESSPQENEIKTLESNRIKLFLNRNTVKYLKFL